MSLAPRPWTTPFSRRPGRLSCAGTVSRWPARRTSGRSPRSVTPARTHVSPAALRPPGEDARVARVARRDAARAQHLENVRREGVLLARLGGDVDELE